MLESLSSDSSRLPRSDDSHAPESRAPLAGGTGPAAESAPPSSSACAERVPEVPPRTAEQPAMDAVEESSQPSAFGLAGRARRQRGRRLVKPAEAHAPLTAEQRLLLLDTWRRSGLPAGDFAALVGLSKHTLYAWKRKFEIEGPAGLDDKPRGGPKGSRLPEVTRRAIVMLKQDNPDWGCEKISAML